MIYSFCKRYIGEYDSNRYCKSQTLTVERKNSWFARIVNFGIAERSSAVRGTMLKSTTGFTQSVEFLVMPGGAELVTVQ